jgi:hypothetical protein
LQSIDNTTMKSNLSDPEKLRRQYSIIVMVLILATWGTFSLIWGERIPINHGFGWDGQKYGAIAQEMNIRSLNTYYFQRILPSAIVHFSLTALQQPLDPYHVTIGFGLLNLLLMVLSCALYRLIANELNLHPLGLWVGYIGLFVNFAHLKFALYDPVLTDVTAATISLSMLLFYLRRQQVMLAVVTVLGALTWPTLIYIGISMLVFPRKPIDESESKLGVWVSLGTVVYVFVRGFWFCYKFYILHSNWEQRVAQPIGIAIPLSLLLCVLYVCIAFNELLRGISANTLLASLSPWWAAVAAILFASAKIPAHLWAAHTDVVTSLHGTIVAFVEHSVVKPAGFLVAHAMYFGPAFLLFIFYWKPFARIIRNYGFGLTIVILMGIFTSINTESRQNLPAYMIAVPFLGLLIEQSNLSARFVWLMGAVALVFSKCWMAMNLPSYDSGEYLNFPFQSFFMNLGPWMSNQMYALQGLVTLAAAGILYTYGMKSESEVRAKKS